MFFCNIKGLVCYWCSVVLPSDVVMFSYISSVCAARVVMCETILETLCSPASINVTPGLGLKKPLSVSAWLDSLSPHLSLCRKPHAWFPPTPVACVCARIYIRDTTPLCSKAPCPVARIACVYVSVCVHASSLKSLVSAVLAFTVKRDLPDTLSCIPALKQSKQLLHSCLTEWGKAQCSLSLFNNVDSNLSQVHCPHLCLHCHTLCVRENKNVIIWKFLSYNHSCCDSHWPQTAILKILYLI